MESLRHIKFNYFFIGQGSKVEIRTHNEKEYFFLKTKDQDVIFVAKHVIEVTGEELKEAYLCMETTLFFDVGNLLTAGAFDHHQFTNGIEINDEKYMSTTSLLTLCSSNLEQLSKVENEFNVIVHSEPDFDCFASAYLAREFLSNGQFPPNYEKLVDYAVKIDSGEMGINYEQLITPYTITLSMGEVIDAKLKQDEKFQKNTYLKNKELNQQLMLRGLQLIECLMKRLNELSEPENSLYSPTILERNNDFKEEMLLVNEDYKKYLNDKKNSCEKIKIRLPKRDGEDRLIEVDGLIFERPPTCCLHKLWARKDAQSPSGKGYVFTFIPFDVSADKTQLATELKSLHIPITRVIISVDPTSSVSLKGLGESLEIAECEKEKQILEDKSPLWRSREKRRFDDEWCTNEDPWYDGRSAAYTIVDSPRKGSLLTLEEIKKIAKNFTQPRIKKNSTKIIYPFHFCSNKYEEIVQELRDNNHKILDCVQKDEEYRSYFRPYIQNYLFGTDKSSSDPGYCSHFKFNKNKDVFNTRELVKSDEYLSKQGVSLDVEQEEILLFKFGVGFFIIDTNITSNNPNVNIQLQSLLRINHHLCNKWNEKQIITEHYLNQIDPRLFSYYFKAYEKGLSYTSIVLDGKTFFTADKEEILYKLCSNSYWDSSFDSNSKHMKETLKRMFYDLNKNAIFGFSKAGSALLLIENDLSVLPEKQAKAESDNQTFIFDHYISIDFDIYMMALHQRYAFMSFSRQLSTIKFKQDKKSHVEISNLRKTLLEFIVQGWYSQITNDEIGMEKYKKWSTILETDMLHNEVLEQVSTLDDYTKSITASRFTKISAIFFPIVTLNAFIGLGIVSYPEWIEFTSLFAWVNTGLFVLIILYFLNNKKE